MTVGRIPSVEGGIQPTIFDAKGDIITASAADTVARLAVGANDTVLTADSTTATGLKWATPSSGGMTLLSTTTLSGASVTLSSIPQTYTSLYLVISGVTNATADGVFAVNPNSAFTSSQVAIRSFDASAVAVNGDFRVTADKDLDRLDANNIFAITFNNYTSTTAYKSFNWYGFYKSAAITNNAINGGGAFKSNTAITSINIKNYGGNLLTGTVLLYGVK